MFFLFRYLRRKISTRISKHPETPDVTQICSKRSFDGQAKKWRRELHLWDPEEEEDLIEPVLVSSLTDLCCHFKLYLQAQISLSNQT